MRDRAPDLANVGGPGAAHIAWYEYAITSVNARLQWRRTPSGLRPGLVGSRGEHRLEARLEEPPNRTTPDELPSLEEGLLMKRVSTQTRGRCDRGERDALGSRRR